MPTEFDDREFPLLRLHAVGESRDADIEDRLAFVERHLLKGPRVALVFDTSRSRPLSARQRRMWTDWLRAHDALIRKNVAGVALVVTSTLIRGVFTGVFWVWQPPMPYTFTGTVRDADAWARARLAEPTSRPLP